MRSSNPVFRSLERSEAYVGSEAATYRGIIGKTALLLITAVISGYLSLMLIPAEMFYPALIAAFIIALISVLVATRSPRLAMPFSLIYAISEGFILGVVTLIFEMMVPGVAFAALIGTGSIFTVMLFLYSSRTIRVTPRFRKIMYSVLLSIMLFFVLSLIFGLTSIFFTSQYALLISGVLIVFGALMLTLDFDRAEMIVESGADKSYEWMVSVGLMVTIVWIYFELLRFLAILSSRRN
ncbi:MAG: Bax inhibitor-1/YccA family protein [Tenericutes bacterium]|nr:Bax inhibitor-1/YccA family protein [Mycoplasmatota bacterium]